jgi:hypothetical protein
VTSPPAILPATWWWSASSIGDNPTVDVGRGTVRAFERPQREAALVVRFRCCRCPTAAAPVRPNVWSVMAVDDARGMLFLPTSSPSPRLLRRAAQRRQSLRQLRGGIRGEERPRVVALPGRPPRSVGLRRGLATEPGRGPPGRQARAPSVAVTTKIGPSSSSSIA